MLFKLLFLPFGLVAHAQEISSLTFSGSFVIPYNYDFKGNVVGGLSGIVLNTNDNSYYLIADKPPARIFKAIININDIEILKFVETFVLSPTLLAKSELEGIAYNYRTYGLYVADEQKNGTRIFELNNEAEFVRIVEPRNQRFIPLSGYNSGIEGLTISYSTESLYYAFERPTKDCLKRSIIPITRKDLTGLSESQTYYYQLHSVDNDELNTNGVSEILFQSHLNLLIMERAYIPYKGFVVRLYLANLEGSGVQGNGKDINCNDSSIAPIKSKLIFDFAEVSAFEIDNAEGMAFSADKSQLYIVTDNNFSMEQKTQIIVLDVIW
eukprot:GHVR01190965.1.p1 GENE.GHVR01190965.1~~GHVR01190965.1.p1  ORF type:complete len:324 (+),score=5.80 GHVR01190965.1:249-1220(+)